ncbi:peroxiredoxin family protein [Paludisphaera rhizosphaerae]|uniref:peroxiredoxin family protein n=1 Tax=Paludisphaera rhizosphaerae TaxID=2711216 RepID=UPI0013EC6CDE|nr:redoxin domain-containing protein [Paludisphaera rhizosphaerae]
MTTNRITGLLFAVGVSVLAFAALKSPASYHPVTPTMTEAAGAMAGRRAPDATATDASGRAYSPAKESEQRPVVLFFIQDGCPCSEAAAPYFRSLHAAYGESASFLGVIDGDQAVARDWAESHQSPFPILADPDHRLIKACQAERSVYVMLVAPGGAVEALWPGYSADMLTDLGSRLARLTGRTETPVDTRGAPEELVSGCAF